MNSTSSHDRRLRPTRQARSAQSDTDDLAALRTASHHHRLDAAVTAVVQEWSGVIPTLDLDVRAIAARIARINDRLAASTTIILQRSGLSDNEFRLLAGLMRIGSPHRCAPTELAGRFVPVTSGGLTGLANRMEERGFVRRIRHPHDQRSMLIELTQAGKKLALRTMQEFALAEQALMASLSPTDRARGNAFLRKLLRSIETALP